MYFTIFLLSPSGNSANRVKMEPINKPGIDRILHQLSEVLRRTGDRVLTSIRRNVRLGPGAIDADCTVTWSGGQIELLIEYKEKGLPGLIRNAASQLRSFQSAFSDTEALPVFAAPYISDAGMDVCRQEGIGCIDEAGNCLLPMPGSYIEIGGRKNPRPESRPIKSAFSPKSSRILRVLLANVGKWWQVQELAIEADISIGLVSRIKQRLLDEELVVEKERRIQVRSPRALIDVWAEGYRYKRSTFCEYFSLDDASTREAGIADWCRSNDVRYALALFSAAARMAPHVRMNKSFVFIDGDPGVVANARDLKHVSSGANVILLKPYDQGVFYDCSEYEGLKVVSDVQAYLDLKSYRGRGEEAAEFLMKQVLEKRWFQSRNTALVK